MLSAVLAGSLFAQGVTTGAINGIVMDANGTPLENVTVTAVHEPSGTSYRGVTRDRGTFTILNMRVGGPYRVTAQLVGYRPGTQSGVTVSLAQTLRLDFQLAAQTVEVAGIDVTAVRDPVMNADRTGAATFIDPNTAAVMPTIKRSTRDLTRLDPRSDGNFSFGGRNWLYNNISVDGSLFTNSFGLDDPSPGGQTNAEPLPYDAVEQVQVSLAPFDVRQGGFTGASVNTVTRSGTNQLRGTAYSFRRSDFFEGNNVRGSPVAADPRLTYQQSGFSLGGPLQRDRLFFFVNAEIERTDNPGSDYVACTTTCGSANQPLGVSRARRDTMDLIRQRMMAEYNYDTGPYEGYIHETDNDKLLVRLDWNVSANHSFMFRYSYLDARRDLGPHPFVLSPNGSGRAPSRTTLPFRNSGYRMNNNLNSFAVELNSRSEGWANRLFASYNRFRDHRDPFSTPFPTIDIAEDGVTYTTVGHEPFSIHNILDQNVLQLTNNFSLFRGAHTLTFGLNYERFSYFNSFNIFRHGVFFFPYGFFPGTARFGSVAQFLAETDPGNPNQADFNSFIGSGPYKGEDISVGILSLYAQDELLTSPRFNLTVGLRMDMPHYPTSITANPFSTGLTLLDENDQAETVDQAKLPGAAMMLSPRIGFNWNARGDRATQVRGGTGVFTGRVPFVWIGNVYSNPGANPNVWGPFNTGVPQVPTGSPEDSSILQQSFDLNAVDPDFRFPQVWTTDLAVDTRLPWNLLGTVEFIYSKDLNAIYMRNADLRAPVGTNPVDGRPFFGACDTVAFGGAANCPTVSGTTNWGAELNPDGAGVFVLDNTNEGYSWSLTFQLRRQFSPSLSASLGYTHLQARNNLKSTEIASVLFAEQPNVGDPNRPELSYSEFGQRHRFVGTLTWQRQWSARMRTQIGVYFEMAEGNVFSNGAFGANRYSFRYAGDVNGDGVGGNDLMYIPRGQSDIVLDTLFSSGGAVVATPAQQWTALDAFINQDEYLSAHRGQIAERFGLINPWYHNMDVRVLHDVGLSNGHRLQLSFDVLNFTNLLSSSMGVRKYANPAALAPLTLTGFDANGTPHFNFTGPSETFIDHPGVLSRWRMQFGVRYLFH